MEEDTMQQKRDESPAPGESYWRERAMHIFRDFAFLALFFILLVVWLVSWAAFHVAGGMIHLLLVLAVIFLIIHFFNRRGIA
jgi:hypothetical protein